MFGRCTNWFSPVVSVPVTRLIDRADGIAMCTAALIGNPRVGWAPPPVVSPITTARPLRHPGPVGFLPFGQGIRVVLDPVRSRDEYPDQQPARLDGRVVAVLQHDDPVYRIAREPGLYLVVNNPFKLVQLGAFHGGLRSGSLWQRGSPPASSARLLWVGVAATGHAGPVRSPSTGSVLGRWLGWG